MLILPHSTSHNTEPFIRDPSPRRSRREHIGTISTVSFSSPSFESHSAQRSEWSNESSHPKPFNDLTNISLLSPSSSYHHHPSSSSPKKGNEKERTHDNMPDANEHGLVDIDDIVDPMIRRADAGLLKDRVKVLCNSTKGPLHIEMYPRSWGSRGAGRFLSLVRAGLFSTPVALHRAVKNFIIQFGTPGDGGAWSKSHQGEFPFIPDDPQWLTLGPACGGKRKLGKGPCRRHRKGFMSFAGGGRNSRRIEMFVSLTDTGHGGNGEQSTHEVPFGRILPSSFSVMDKLYTGYGGEIARSLGHPI